jgi:hypothetical protein
LKSNILYLLLEEDSGAGVDVHELHICVLPASKKKIPFARQLLCGFFRAFHHPPFPYSPGASYENTNPSFGFGRGGSGLLPMFGAGRWAHL